MKANLYRLPDNFDPREYWMSEEDFVQARKDSLYEQEQLRDAIDVLLDQLKQRATTLSQLGQRLAAEPQNVLIEHGDIHLTRRNTGPGSVFEVPAEHLDVQVLAGLTDELRAKQKRLAEVDTLLKNK